MMQMPSESIILYLVLKQFKGFPDLPVPHGCIKIFTRPTSSTLFELSPMFS